MLNDAACPECGSFRHVRDYEKGEIICRDCGYIIVDKIMDLGKEWREFDKEQQDLRSRAGPPITNIVHDKGLSTVIGDVYQDSYGNRLSSKERAHAYKLKKWQRKARISNTKERNLAMALTELNLISSHLGLPYYIKDTAARLYRQAANKGLIRGRTIECAMAAVIYAACRESEIPRTLDEIISASNIRKRDIGKTYRLIVRELGIQPHLQNPIDYVSRFGSALGASGKVQSTAIKLLKKAKRKGAMSGRGPCGAAAAALYTAGILCGEYYTQQMVAEAAGITEISLRQSYKEIKMKLGLKI